MARGIGRPPPVYLTLNKLSYLIFACRLSPSHSPLRFALALTRKTENEAPEKEAGLRKYIEIGRGNLFVDIGA